jgi:nicotinamidase-related amidase
VDRSVEAISRRACAKLALGLGLGMTGAGAAESAMAAESAPRTLMDFAGVRRTPADWSKAALLVIDPQLEYFSGQVPLVDMPNAIAEIQRLQAMARAAKAPIFHIVHHAKPGSTLFDPQKEGSKIIPALAPAPGEAVVTKPLPNALTQTTLHEQLQAAKRQQLVICGFATHMCVSATTRSALDHGYTSTVVASACSTRDLPDPVTGGVTPAAWIHRSALAGLHDRFALVVPNTKVWSA